MQSELLCDLSAHSAPLAAAYLAQLVVRTKRLLETHVDTHPEDADRHAAADVADRIAALRDRCVAGSPQ